MDNHRDEIDPVLAYLETKCPEDERLRDAVPYDVVQSPHGFPRLGMQSRRVYVLHAAGGTVCAWRIDGGYGYAVWEWSEVLMRTRIEQVPPNPNEPWG